MCEVNKFGWVFFVDHDQSERDLSGPDAQVADQVRVSWQGQRHGEILQGAGRDAARAGLRLRFTASKVRMKKIRKPIEVSRRRNTKKYK